jgi:hypothetical protein
MKFETPNERFSRCRSDWIMARLAWENEERRLRGEMDDAYLTDDEFYEKRGLLRGHQVSKGGGDHT